MVDLSEFKRLQAIADKYHLEQHNKKSSASEVEGQGAAEDSVPLVPGEIDKNINPTNSVKAPEIVTIQGTDPQITLENLMPLLPTKKYAHAKRILDKLGSDPNATVTASGKVIIRGNTMSDAQGLSMLREYISPRKKKTSNQESFNDEMNNLGYNMLDGKRIGNVAKGGAKKAPKPFKWYYVGWD